MTERHFCLDDSPWFRMVELGDVTSTNDFLRSYRPVGPERQITLVTAEYQTAGRGAGTNGWESERGKNLLFSMLVHPRHIPADRMFVLSEILSLSILEGLVPQKLNFQFSIFNLPFTIKWPNDIYWGDKKLCGMLIENELQGDRIERCVMGAGININQTEFAFDRTRIDDSQKSVRKVAEPTSLALITGETLERRFVLEQIMENFTRYYEWTEQGREKELHEMYLSHLYRRGEMARFHDEKGDFCGRIVDVEPTGHLIIEDEAGQMRRYGFKEVEITPSRPPRGAAIK